MVASGHSAWGGVELVKCSHVCVVFIVSVSSLFGCGCFGVCDENFFVFGLMYCVLRVCQWLESVNTTVGDRWAGQGRREGWGGGGEQTLLR